MSITPNDVILIEPSEQDKIEISRIIDAVFYLLKVNKLKHFNAVPALYSCAAILGANLSENDDFIIGQFRDTLKEIRRQQAERKKGMH